MEVQAHEDGGDGVGVPEEKGEVDCAPMVEEANDDVEEEIPQEPVMEQNSSPVVAVKIKLVFVPAGIASPKTVS